MEKREVRRAAVTLTNDAARIRDVTVTYADGSSVSGFPSMITQNDFGPVVRLCKHTCLRGESPEVMLDFDSAVTIEVTLHDKTIERFGE